LIGEKFRERPADEVNADLRYVKEAHAESDEDVLEFGVLLYLVVVGCEFVPEESHCYAEERKQVANDGVIVGGLELEIVFLDFY
jgi:hypothetical protein